MSVTDASKKYGVPRQTLNNHARKQNIEDDVPAAKNRKMQYSEDDFEAAMEEIAKGGIIWPFVILETN